MATPSFQFVHFLCFCLLEMIFLYDVTFLGLYYRTSWNAKFKFKFPKLVLPLLLGGILWDTSFIGAEVTGQKTGHCWTLLHYISLPCGIISLSWASWFGAFQTHKHDWRPFTTSTVSESRPVENFLGAKGPQATASFGKTIYLVKMEATQSNRFSTCRLDPRRDRVKMVKEQEK